MKNGKFFWGSVLILTAVVIILQQLGVTTELFAVLGGISVWDIIMAIVGLALLITSFIKLEFGWSVILLATAYIAFEDNIAYLIGREGEDLANNWIIFGAAVLIAIGINCIFGGIKKKRSRTNLFSDTVIYVDSSTLTPSFVSNKLGDCKVYFENQMLYPGGKTLEISNKLGDMVIHVPADWKVDVDINNHMGDISVSKHPDEDAEIKPILKITGENKMGDVTISYK